MATSTKRRKAKPLIGLNWVSITYMDGGLVPNNVMEEVVFHNPDGKLVSAEIRAANYIGQFPPLKACTQVRIIAWQQNLGGYSKPPKNYIRADVKR